MHVPVRRFGGVASTSGRAIPHHGIRIAPSRGRLLARVRRDDPLAASPSSSTPTTTMAGAGDWVTLQLVPRRAGPIHRHLHRGHRRDGGRLRRLRRRCGDQPPPLVRRANDGRDTG